MPLLTLQEDESFNLSANVQTPGYIRTVLKGYLISKRSGKTYIAPLIPQLFYGASGQQLTTWRQHIPQTGEQVILSRRAGGYPEVPRGELYWREVTPKEEEAVKAEVRVSLVEWFRSLPWYVQLLIIAGATATVFGSGYLIARSLKG